MKLECLVRQPPRDVLACDVDGEFATTVDSQNLDGMQLVRLDQTPALRVKLNMERQPGQRWLVYGNQSEPAWDWLLDVRLRGKSFRADASSIFLEELDLTTQALRHLLMERVRFLRAKDLVDRLKRLVLPGDATWDLDRKMLAVLTRADQPEVLATDECPRWSTQTLLGSQQRI